MANNVFELKDISYAYLDRFTALSGIDLSVKEKERVALLGSNGSGKSTLLLILAGLIFPAQGTVKFFGQDLTEKALSEADLRTKFRRSVSIVFQNSDVQLFNSNVEDEVLFGLAQLGLHEYEMRTRLAQYLKLMEIEHLRDRHPQYLSVGEKKRVALASVLAMEPEILLLDEPTAGLDPRTTRHLLDTVAELGEKGRTIIFSTQDIHIVSEIADRVIVLSEDKRIVQDGPVAAVLEDKSFLEKHNLVHVHAHRHDGKVHVHPHEHPSHDHPHV